MGLLATHRRHHKTTIMPSCGYCKDEEALDDIRDAVWRRASKHGHPAIVADWECEECLDLAFGENVDPLDTLPELDTSDFDCPINDYVPADFVSAVSPKGGKKKNMPIERVNGGTEHGGYNSGGYGWGTGSGQGGYQPYKATPVCNHWGDQVVWTSPEGHRLYGAKGNQLDPFDGYDVVVDLANNLTGWTGKPKETNPFYAGTSQRLLDALFPTVVQAPKPKKIPEVLRLDWPDMKVAAGVEIDFYKKFWELLPKKASVVVACMGGHGRTGTFLAALLIARGMTPKVAVDTVREHHCEKAVESEAQIDYLNLLGFQAGVVTKEELEQIKASKEAKKSHPTQTTSQANNTWGNPGADKAIEVKVSVRNNGGVHVQPYYITRTVNRCKETGLGVLQGQCPNSALYGDTICPIHHEIKKYSTKPENFIKVEITGKVNAEDQPPVLVMPQLGANQQPALPQPVVAPAD